MAQQNFGGLHVWDEKRTLGRMLKKARLLTRPTLRVETHLAPIKDAASEEAMHTLFGTGSL